MEVKMKELHLVPVNIQDIVEKLNSPITNVNERLLLEKRLEVIRDYINLNLKNNVPKLKKSRN